LSPSPSNEKIAKSEETPEEIGIKKETPKQPGKRDK